MAPIADLLAKQGGEGLSGGEGQIIRAHFATIESELKELRAVTRELRAAAKRPRLTP
jgi:hypothetical protein